jgi:hypothetical protein
MGAKYLSLSVELYIFLCAEPCTYRARTGIAQRGSAYANIAMHSSSTTLDAFK